MGYEITGIHHVQLAMPHGEELEGSRRFHVRDPFGNRIELVEPA